ncbi:type II and III secretion system protein [Gemmata sp. JC673]|uniref:Type II and III secretion system protein n=1 Tax=Gemmata algarum TaxID=2975278 RepID=A0ABU5F1N6_9BACT|nr:hypothetical protein [Gemmata algarum]MDY3561094.1 type II and III secretion system protein [Gemmata algarum]
MALVAVGLGAVAANNGPLGVALTPPAAPVKELAKETEAKPTANADEVTGLDWAKDEELAKRAVEALKRDPKAVPSVVIQSVCVRVPDGFCDRVGLIRTAPLKPGTGMDQWQLSQREVRMLKGLLATERNCIVASRHQLVVADGKTGAAKTLQKLDVVTRVQAATEDGVKVYTARTQPVEVGFKFQFAPKLVPHGLVSLDVKSTYTGIAGSVTVGEVQAPAIGGFTLTPSSLISGGEAIVIKTGNWERVSPETVTVGGTQLTEISFDSNRVPFETLQLFTVYVAGPPKIVLP